MKRIIGVVRVGIVGEVLRELFHSGFEYVNVFDMKVFGDAHDPKHEHLSFEYEKYYSKMSRIEVLCMDNDALKAIEVIKHNARTQHQGDGYVFISALEGLTDISSCKEGKQLFQS